MDFKEYCIASDINYFETIIEAIVKKRIGMDVDSSLLEPETGKPWRANNKKKELENVISKITTPKDKIWVTFSNYQRLGIYYKASDGSTPLGLYAYPIDYVLENGLNVPYGGNRKYILVFEMISENVVSMKKGKTEIPDFESIRKKISDDKKFVVKNFRKVFMKKTDLIINNTIKKSSLPKNLNNNLVEMLYNLKSDVSYESNDFGLKEIIKSLEFPQKSEMLEKIKTFVHGMKIRSGGVYVSIGNLDEKTLRTYLSDELIDQIKASDEHEKQKMIKDGLNWNEKNEKESFFDDITKLMSSYYFNLSYPPLEQYGSEKIKIYIDLLKNPEFLNDALEISKKIKNSLEKSLDKFNSKKGKYLQGIHFPLEQQLKQICTKYKVDWIDILEKTMNEMWSDQGTVSGSFVYKFTKSMAEVLSRKLSIRYWALWTKILRELGIDAVIDPEGTGSIHSSEPTQGAFFNPRQFKLLAVLQNNKFSTSGLSNSWEHPKQIRKQKRKSDSGLSWEMEDTPANRFLKGIQKGFLTINPIPIQRNSPAESIKFLTKFQILLDSFIKQKDNPDTDQNLKNEIKEYIKKLSAVLILNKIEAEKLLIPKVGEIKKLAKPFIKDEKLFLYGRILEKTDDGKYLIKPCDRYGHWDLDNEDQETVPASDLLLGGLNPAHLKQIIYYHSSVINYLIKIGLLPSENEIKGIIWYGDFEYSIRSAIIRDPSLEEEIKLFYSKLPSIPSHAEFLKPSKLRINLQ